MTSDEARPLVSDMSQILSQRQRRDLEEAQKAAARARGWN